MTILRKHVKRLWTRTIAYLTKKQRCLICERGLSINQHDTIYAKAGLCRSCYYKMPFAYKRFKVLGVDCLAIYRYEGLVKEAIYNLKGNHDIALAPIFLGSLKERLKDEYRGYTIVPVPSLGRLDRVRGFNHVVEIFKVLGLPMNNIFIKSKEWKQSDHHFKERANIRNIIKLRGQIDARKKYLIVDDVMTSQETIKTCIKILKENKVQKIRVLVVSYRDFK